MVILCHGLMQPRKISNGLATLRAETCKQQGCQLADVPYYGWTESGSALTSLAQRVCALPPDERVGVAAHSWGVWWANYRLAPEVSLIDPGRRIDALFSCDGVMHPRPSGTLVISDVFAQAWRWRQETNKRIRGSEMELSSRTQLMLDELVPATKHSRMDEHAGFHEAVLRWLKGVSP